MTPQEFVDAEGGSVKYISSDRYNNVSPQTLWVDHLLSVACYLQSVERFDDSEIILDAAIMAESKVNDCYKVYNYKEYPCSRDLSSKTLSIYLNH